MANGWWLVSAGEEIKAWDLMTGHELLSIKEGYNSVGFSPDRRTLVAVDQGQVRLYRAATDQEVRTRGNTDP